MPELLTCIDVYYTDDDRAVAGALTFDRWEADEPLEEFVVVANEVADYVPGEFYRRELPPVLSVLQQLPSQPDVIVVDGYVWLDEFASVNERADCETKSGRMSEFRPGLGAWLFDSLEEQSAVIGVAKNRYRDSSAAIEVCRGTSARPLFVTSVGLPARKAAESILKMSGPHRIPTLLKRVDRLGRDTL